MAISNTRAKAVVYRLPEGQVTTATLMGGATQPFRTSSDGYLQGRGPLGLGDQLVALLPTSVTLSFTHQSLVYHTSAAPTETGLAMKLVATPGVQVLTTTANHPLILFDLDVSLEWDARNDGAFLANLAEGIKNASAILYDISNGQVALGEVRIHQAKANWVRSDIVIYANNSIRPTASMGGVTTYALTDTLTTTEVINDAYLPGQIHMGPIWDPFGENQADLTTYWWQALAHELAHYLLFLPDNYLGVADDQVVLIDCQGSVMTNAYDSGYSEFLTRADWEDDCLDSVAEHTTGRTDWETILAFYPMLSDSLALAGPAVLPLDVTQVVLESPGDTAVTFPAQNFDIRDGEMDTLAFHPQAQGYLFKTQGTDDITDDGLILLGSTSGSGDRLKVRGATEGDRLCVVDNSRDPVYIGCVDNLTLATTSVAMQPVENWRPDIVVQPVSSHTLRIMVTLAATETNPVHVQMLPAYGAANDPQAIVSPAAVMTVTNPGNPVTYTQILTVPEPAFAGVIRVWVSGSIPEREAFSSFYLGSGWGPTPRRLGGNANRAWWANDRALMAPISSAEGQVTIYNVTNIFADTGTASLQALASLPELPIWLSPVGQGYRFAASEEVSRTISFTYLQRDVPDVYERDENMAIYYYNEAVGVWQPLPTFLDTRFNLASATMPVSGDGIYALMITIRMPELGVGWNNFGYPVPGTRAITTALASIDCCFTSIYEYDASLSPAWRMYERVVHEPFADLVNDLHSLRFGYGYWLYATRTVTLFMGIPDTNNMTATPMAPAFVWPPATFYGWVTSTAGFSPTVGMVITATVDGTVCGQTTVVSWQGKLAYKLQVQAENPFGMPNGCGASGRDLSFQVGPWLMDHDRAWDNSQAWLHSLSKRQDLPLSPHLVGATSPLGLQLSWNTITQTIGGSQIMMAHYEVWRSSQPYFEPGDDGAVMITETADPTYWDDVVTSPVYYLIVTVDAYGGKSLPSNLVGYYRYELTPGSQ